MSGGKDQNKGCEDLCIKAILRDIFLNLFIIIGTMISILLGYWYVPAIITGILGIGCIGYLIGKEK